MQKKILALIVVGTMWLMAGCGNTSQEETGENTAESTEAVVDLGTPMDVLDGLYETAELDADLKEQIDNGGFQQGELDETIATMFLGEADITYVSGVGSMPMMSSIAYQVVVLQLEDGEDVEAAKVELLETADTGKWVCVEPESVVAVSRGNYVVFVMSDSATATALVDAFQKL